jgi:hypothetical protein
MAASKRMHRKLIGPDDVARAFSEEQIETLAAVFPETGDVDLKQLRKLILCDAQIFAQASRVPDNNELRKQITKLEEAGRTKNKQGAAKILDKLYAKNQVSLQARWTSRHPYAPFPASSSLDTEEADWICDSLASICRDGGQYVEGHLRKGGRRSREWKTILHAPHADRNIKKVSAEQDLVTNLALTWFQITGDQPPNAVHKDLSAPFAKFAQRVFETVGAAGSVYRRINEHGEKRKLQSLVGAAIWRWQNPLAEWSSMPVDLGDWKLVKNRFDNWAERVSCEEVFSEMTQNGRSKAAIRAEIIHAIESANSRRSSLKKKAQRERSARQFGPARYGRG